MAKRLTLISGGVRSGKSALAEAIAAVSDKPVSYLATLAAGDDEMRRRITAHQERRPANWQTLEIAAVEELDTVFDSVEHGVLLLDCVAGFVTNILLADEDADDAAIKKRLIGQVQVLLSKLDNYTGTVIVVTNEVGYGVVPPSRLGRLFRDLLGITNRMLAAEADDVLLVAMGIPLALKGSVPATNGD